MRSERRTRSAGPGRWCAGLLASVVILSSPISAVAAVSWQAWTFDHQVSGYYDGLSLRNVTFQGRPLIRKLSFPVMRVFYENDACGPYADRLGGTVYPIPWANNARLAQRQFTLNGRQWYEIGIRDKIGNYDIYQVYYLSADGIIDAHVNSKGLQCVANHVHYPNWRIDFDLDGAASDQIMRESGAGLEVMTREFDASATAAAGHAWRVRDASTGLAMDVLPGFPDFSLPDQTVVPVDTYAGNTVFGRLYRSTEDRSWRYGPNTQVPFNDAEAIDNADTVLWYEGYLPHSASDGSALWHSTGVRLVADLDVVPPPPPPPPPPGPAGTASFTGSSVTIADGQPASQYPSAVTVAGLAGTVAKVTVRLDGLAHTYPDDLDIALVSPWGQAVMLMSDAGGGNELNGVTLTFDSTVAATLPSVYQIYSGTYKPANYGSTDAFAPPAPGGSYPANLDILKGFAPNGTWQLFIVDDASGDTGALAGGWTLTITTQ